MEIAEDLRAAVGDFVRQVRAYETMPPGQAGALGHLVREGPLSIADLARRERVKHQSMTRTVGLLESQGLVTLAPAEHDRRQMVVAVTGAGAARLGEQRQVRAGRIAEAMATLGAEERELVARIPAIIRKLTP
ncbi:MarR family transcriptional regulator [Actinoplanes sp. LDG1-06]|uniref:MarR family transcriptional regulator n=2 Tax=Paractinoplanes ovalisporus TaxID=2810368 RepID=A0ABS2AEF4_9ACTN|nr:MarR family transcriptional regulator [Actinoplanes ovalisporus]